MGKHARELVGDIADELIGKLNKAYADEWIAYFYYKHAAQMAKGLKSKILADALEKTAEEELEHATELAERIIQLGGEPINDFGKIVSMANCPKVNYPGDWGDLKGILNALIEAERCAINVYNGILNWLMNVGKDPITFHVIRHIMQEELEHEDEFETLLGV